MFDFTKEIELDKKNYTLYKRLQLLLYLAAVVWAFYLAFVIIFPNLPFTFSFLNPSSSKNTVYDPRQPDNTFPNKGVVQNELIFNTNFFGDYSVAEINLNLNKKSLISEPITISARKSYQSFFYDDGGLMGFKEGSLLKNGDDFYIVSGEKLRRFANLNILLSLGYSPSNFQEVSTDELKYNSPGEDIKTSQEYPDSTFFRIDENYYIMKNQTLEKFVGNQAFLSSYSANQAIEKNIDFLNNYPLSENSVGFNNGTILAYDVSAYVINNNEILPIDNILTFENKGFIWDDVLKASSDEIANYKKGKLFTINTPHPDGTVFKTIDNSKNYLVKDGLKYLLPTENIAQSWLKKNPVNVSEEGLKIESICYFKQSTFNSRLYSCDIPLNNFGNLIGTSYEFNLKSNEQIKIDSIDINFKKNVNVENFKEFFSNLLTRIKQNYVSA